MFGNVIAEKRVLETTYEDTCIVSRDKPVNTGSSSITKLELVDIYTDVICAISAKGDSSKQTEAQHRIEYDMLLFVPPEIIVEPGDQVTVKRFGRINPSSTFIESFEIVGKPVPYVTHTQLKLKAVGLA